MHAYIGNIAIVADQYAIVYRQGVRVINLRTDDPDEAHDKAQREVERLGLWGYHIPDASPYQTVYRNLDFLAFQLDSVAKDKQNGNEGMRP